MMIETHTNTDSRFNTGQVVCNKIVNREILV
ncbi:MAG: hypothetical protein RL660_1700 [Bacteroidota bacterium]|jgi:hypothetical protein